MNAPTPSLNWEAGDTSRIPFAVYTDATLHAKEMQRFFYENHWCYVGLEAEVPNPGDFKLTKIGERSVVWVRDHDQTLHVV
ncbi:MAG: salicylate hydroxylase, partial [Burkholderiaceae bacterium]